MDDGALTNQAIAELLREMEGNNAIPIPKSERKINPLGKPNIRFLGRTLNSAVQHNKRELERSRVNCQQKLKELNDRCESRKRNSFYNSDKSYDKSYAKRQRRNDDNDNPRSHKKKRKRKKEKKSKKHHRSKSTSRSRSRSRSRSKSKSTSRSRRKSRSTSRSRRKSRSTSNSNETTPTLPTYHQYYPDYCNQVALAVATAYKNLLSVQETVVPNPNPNVESNGDADVGSSTVHLNDILNELMSDDELEPLTVQSSDDEEEKVQAIDCDSDSIISSSSSTSSCIELKDESDDDDISVISVSESNPTIPPVDLASIIDLTDD